MRFLRVSAETPTADLFRDALKRTGLVGVGFALLMTLGTGIVRGVAAAVFFAAFMFLFFAAQAFSQRRSARRRAASGAPPLSAEDRPAYVPGFWPDDAATRWSMRTPQRALVTFATPGVIFGGLLFWRIADHASFVRNVGDGTAAIILVAGPIMLGFSWYYGVRAWTAMRERSR